MEFKNRGKTWISAAQAAYKAQQMRKKYQDLESELLERLKELSQNESSKGGEFAYEANERKGSIDYSVIPELKKVNLEKYRKDSVTTWKLYKV